MTITFEPLTESHFPFLLKWLEAPHVKAWWDQDVKWTLELIWEKFGSYVKGYKRLKLKDQVIEKPMHAFIISLDDTPIGYIQIYNAYDFPPEQGYKIEELPVSCAGLDWYIGESDFIGKGIGAKALCLFLEQHVFPSFHFVFVDPDTANTAAIRVYEKVGFKIEKLVNKGSITWMLKEKPRGKICQSPLTHELKTHIYEAFGKHAISCTGIDGLAQEPISFEIREADNLVGCVVVQLFWGQLHIKYLLVEEPYRGRGIARRLMEHAFDFGRRQGCRFAFVETMNFQAPEFYQKLGFKIDFVRHGYDKGTSFYYLKRDL